MKDKEIYTVEYSASQDSFHVDELERVLKMNRANCISRNSVDYQILEFCYSYDEADKKCREYRGIMK